MKKREWKRKLSSRKLWAGAAMMGIGCALCLSGQTAAGIILIGIGGLGYLISEALVDIARILGAEEAAEQEAAPGKGTAAGAEAGEPEEEELPDLSEQTAEALREEISTEAADGALNGDTSETTADGDATEEAAAEETEAEA